MWASRSSSSSCRTSAACFYINASKRRQEERRETISTTCDQWRDEEKGEMRRGQMKEDAGMQASTQK